MRELVFEGDTPVIRETRAQMTCTPRQARLAMMATPHEGQPSLLTAVESLIYSLDDDAIIVSWEYATEWKRLDPMLLELAEMLGLDDTALDALFVKAMAM